MESVQPDWGLLDRFTARRSATFYPKTDCVAGNDGLRNLRAAVPADLGITEEVLRMAVAAAFPREFAAVIRPLASQGTFHRLFGFATAGRQYILRVGLGLEAGSGFLFYLERWAAAAANAAGLPSPRVVFIDISRRHCPFDFQVIEFLAGRQLTEFDSEELKVQALLEQFSALLARLHGVAVQGFGWPDVRSLVIEPSLTPGGTFSAWTDYLGLRLDEHIACCEEIGVTDRDEVARIRAVFATMFPRLGDVSPVLLHGDLGGHNILTDGANVLGVVDWEDCLFGDPVYDLAFLATFHPVRRHAGIIAAYGNQRAQPEDFALRFWLYFLRISLAKTVHRWRFGFTDQPGRVPASQRIALAINNLDKLIVRAI